MAPNPRSAVPAALAALAALALAAPAARADLVRLHDGRTVEGKATLSGNKWTLKGYKGKSTTYAASEVKFREEAECSWDVAARMAKEIPADASDTLFAEKRMEIARYLRERTQYTPEMGNLEKMEYEAILKRLPDHDEAHAGLGHVRWANWWFKTDKERDKKRKDAAPAEMEPLGFVKSRKTGMWETKEDAEAIELGKVKYKGRWMTEDEKKEAQGYLKDEKGNWVLGRDLKDRERSADMEKGLGEKPVTVSSSAHFRFISWYPVGETAQMKDLSEKAYAWVRDAVGYPLSDEDAGGEVLFEQPIEVFALIDKKRKDKWLEVYGPGYGMSPSVIEFRREKGGGWHSTLPSAYFLSSAGPTEKNRGRNAEEDFYRLGCQVTSMVGRIVLDRIRGGQTQPWFSEGMGLVTEIRFHETADCCYVTQTKYREEVANKDGSKAKYYEFMRKQIQAGVDRPLRQIFSLDLNNLDWADSVKAWSFLEFLIARYPAEFRKLMRLGFPEVEEITPEQVKAAVLARKPKDPAAAPLPGSGPAKDDGALPTENQRVNGVGAIQVTEGSKEQNAISCATTEAWLLGAIPRPLNDLEEEWRTWIVAHP